MTSSVESVMLLFWSYGVVWIVIWCRRRGSASSCCRSRRPPCQVDLEVRKPQMRVFAGFLVRQMNPELPVEVERSCRGRCAPCRRPASPPIGPSLVGTMPWAFVQRIDDRVRPDLADGPSSAANPDPRQHLCAVFRLILTGRLVERVTADALLVVAAVAGVRMPLEAPMNSASLNVCTTFADAEAEQAAEQRGLVGNFAAPGDRRRNPRLRAGTVADQGAEGVADRTVQRIRRDSSPGALAARRAGCRCRRAACRTRARWTGSWIMPTTVLASASLM